jgi:hypothetical protein
MTVERACYHSNRYGLVFAGKTSVALHAFATLSGMCMALQGSSEDVPSLEDIATLLARVVYLYVRDFRGAAADFVSRAAVEILLFGICPCSRNYEVWKISDRMIDNSLNVICEPQPAELGVVVTIGSQITRFNEVLAELKQTSEVHFRLPRVAIGKMVAENRGDVGGEVSIAVHNQYGFQTFWTVGENMHGQVARLMFGVDLDEIGPVGPTMILGGGMI